MCDRYGVVRLITNPTGAGFSIGFDDEIEIMVLPCPFAEFQHLRKFVGRVDMQDRKGNAPEESLAREPDKNVGVLTHRPGHGYVFEGVIRLAENKDALILDVVKMSACCLGH